MTMRDLESTDPEGAARLARDAELGPSAQEICEYEGHEYADAGGGLEICMRCETERWCS